MNNQTCRRIDMYVGKVEARGTVEMRTPHVVVWREYALKKKNSLLDRYFRNVHPDLRINNRKLLFPETQLIEYDCGECFLMVYLASVCCY